MTELPAGSRPLSRMLADANKGTEQKSNLSGAAAVSIFISNIIFIRFHLLRSDGDFQIYLFTNLENRKKEV